MTLTIPIYRQIKVIPIGSHTETFRPLSALSQLRQAIAVMYATNSDTSHGLRIQPPPWRGEKTIIGYTLQS